MSDTSIHLGPTKRPPKDIDSCSLVDFWDKYARMQRALKNWQEGINGKLEIHVEEENKKWIGALIEETNKLLHHFDFVFE